MKFDDLPVPSHFRSAHGMAERLETIGRKIGLKFMAAPVHGCFYLSTEMFYVEINIDGSGSGSGSSSVGGGVKVNEAKIHHIDATTKTSQQNTVVCSTTRCRCFYPSCK